MTQSSSAPVAPPSYPRIFERSLLGHRSDPIGFTVERGAIRFFAETIGETNPICLDERAARAAGYPDIVAPPTYAIVIEMLTYRQPSMDGRKPMLDLINCDQRRLLHGEERYDYAGLIFAGDQVEVSSLVRAFEDKKGGALELAYVDTTIAHAARGILVTASRCLIHQLS